MQRFSVYILIIATICLWGGSYVAARLLTPGLDTVVLSCVRIIIAFITLLCLCRAGRVKLIPDNKKMILLLCLLGVLGIFLYTLFFHLGIRTVPGGRASVIININPVIIAIGAALFLHERLTPLKICGVLLAALGAAIVVSHGNLASLLSDKISIGDGYMLLAAVCTACFALLGKVLMQKGFRPVQVLTWAVFFGMLCFIISAATTGHVAAQITAYTLRDWLCIVYLGVFSTATAFILFYKILNRLGATGGGVIGSMIPIPAIIFTVLFKGAFERIPDCGRRGYGGGGFNRQRGQSPPFFTVRPQAWARVSANMEQNSFRQKRKCRDAFKRRYGKAGIA